MLPNLANLLLRLGHRQLQHITDGLLELLVAQVVGLESLAPLPQVVHGDQDVLKNPISRVAIMSLETQCTANPHISPAASPRHEFS